MNPEELRASQRAYAAFVHARTVALRAWQAQRKAEEAARAAGYRLADADIATGRAWYAYVDTLPAESWQAREEGKG